MASRKYWLEKKQWFSLQILRQFIIPCLKLKLYYAFHYLFDTNLIYQSSHSFLENQFVLFETPEKMIGVCKIKKN